MSNQFYNYLANNIIEYLNNRELKSGDKFNVQFEDEKQVRELYDALKDLESSNEFIYEINEASKYKSYSVNINGVDVIVAATIENITADFLIRLRNLVGDEEHRDFSNTAILFIHNTSLDSIIRGTESFQKEGMPFHSKSIVKDINKKLETSLLDVGDKHILKFLISEIDGDLFEDHTSVFYYEDILKVLNRGRISIEEYSKFGLFQDNNLLNVNDEKVIKQRIYENAELFKKIDSIHKYGNPEIELEKYFDEKGIKKLKDENNWVDLDYKEIKQSRDNYINSKPIEYERVEIKEDLTFWDRPQGTTKAKARTRNIVVFNDKGLDKIRVEFKFDSSTKKEYIREDKKSDKIISTSNSGKKIEAVLDTSRDQSLYYNIKYKDEKVAYVFKIVVLRCEENILHRIKTNYTLPTKAKDRYIIINSDDEKLILNPGFERSEKEEVKYINSTIELDENQTKELIFNVKMDDNDKYIYVDLNYNGSKISLAKEEEKEQPTTLTGLKVWRLKRENKESFRYMGNNKITQGTIEYFSKEDFRRNLELEEEMVKSGNASYTLKSDVLEPQEIEIDNELKEAYNKLIDFFKKENLLPSLAYWNKELFELMKSYVEIFFKQLKKISNGEVLSKEQRNLSKIGTIEKLDGDKELLLTPMHPLNIAYQIKVNEFLGEDELSEDILKTLNAKYLMPYLYNENKRLYKIADQNHSPEWTYYVDHKMIRYKGSRDYVSKLIREKIVEFIDHFEYLFKYNNNSELKIKLINMGDCKEVLTGIYEYYTKQLDKKGSDIKKLIPISIYIYGDKKITNAFEEISFYDDIESIKNHFGLTLKSKNYTGEDIVNAFRENVHFYKKSNDEEIDEYTHLTFYEMDQDITITSSPMEDINTGISLNGLMSGVPSVYLKDTYRTGFGSKYMPEEKNELLGLSMMLNSLTKSVGTGDPFDKNNSVTISAGEKNQQILNNIYNKSHWVTFIDPKVDLNFFENNNENLLIIHYSDKYTSSSGYDAITVTRRSNQYKAIIEEFLNSKNVEIDENAIPNVINYFNAINGDWLLRLISSKSQFPREKISILSAIKVALAYFYHPDIVWIPISLEEILRISSGIGLNKNSLFSVKNLTGKNESYSDDLLMIGIQRDENNLKVHYYPVEVKIGENNETVISKAISQANKTRALLEENLIETVDDEKAALKKIYRNFLIQLAIVNAEKMNLYKVWDEQDWSLIIDSEVRSKLLNDNYTISDQLDEYIGKGCVISFKKDVCFSSDAKINDDIIVLELAEKEGYTNVITSIEEMKDRYINNKSDFSSEKMLVEKYKKDNQNGEVFLQEAAEEDVEFKPDITVVQGEEPIIHEIEDTSIIIPMEIVFGKEMHTQRQLFWYPTDTEQNTHTNTGIIGTMGTGKTQFTKSLITQLYRQQKHNIDEKPIGMIIFDYKGDYIDDEFVSKTNARVYDLYRLPYNPLALLIPERPKSILPYRTANLLKETISKAFGLGQKQDMALVDTIMEAYRRRGIDKSDKSTWIRQAPTIRDVCSVYFNNEDMKEDKLYAALKTLDEYEVFESDPNETKNLFDIIDGVTVINLSGEDENVQNLVVAITLDIFYNQMLVIGESKQREKYRQLNKMILVDEADNFLSKDFISIKKILKEGRMFGVGTILSTQLLSHFNTAENGYQNYIATWIVHNVSDLNNKDVRYIFNTQSKNEEESIYNKIKSLSKHESLVKLYNEDRPIYIRDKAFWELDR